MKPACQKVRAGIIFFLVFFSPGCEIAPVSPEMHYNCMPSGMCKKIATALQAGDI